MNTSRDKLIISELRTSYKWEIPDFRKMKLPPGENISTRFFTYFGCGSEECEVQWQINLFPQGIVGKPEFVAIFLQIKNPTKVEASFSFSILNRNNERINERQSRYLLTFSQRQFVCGYPDFIRRNVLLDKQYDFLHDEKLIILCDIAIMDCKPIGTVNRLRRLDEFESMIDNEEYSDVHLILDNNQIIYAHKNILANQSTVFDNLFLKEGKKQLLKIAVKDVSYPVLKEMLRCVYAGSVLHMDAHCTVLLRLSYEYGIRRLKLMCAKHLAENINLGNMSELLDLSVQYDVQLLQDEITKFVVANGKALNDEDKLTEIAKLNQGTVIDVLKTLMLDLV